MMTAKRSHMFILALKAFSISIIYRSDDWKCSMTALLALSIVAISLLSTSSESSVSMASNGSEPLDVLGFLVGCLPGSKAPLHPSCSNEDPKCRPLNGEADDECQRSNNGPWNCQLQ